MIIGKYSKNLVGKCLANFRHIFEVEIHLSELFESIQDALRLRARDQMVSFVLCQLNRQMCPTESEIIQVSGDLIEDLFGGFVLH